MPRLLPLLYSLCFASGCYDREASSDLAAGAGGHRMAVPGPVGAGGEPSAGMTDGGAGTEAGAGAPTVDCNPGQFVLAHRVTNARDLGGTPVAEGVVACQTVYRGPPLAALSNEACTDAVALGIGTLIDLRVQTERDVRPNAPCVAGARVLAPLPIPYERSAANYLAVLNAPSMAQVFHTFADASAYPIYFHCTFGRDRTGVVAALLLRALGASRDQVMSEYMLSDDLVGSSPASLEAVLDEIDARGGADVVLSELGLSEDERAALRDNLVVAQ